MPRFFLATAAASGLLSVALGAFAAHGLKHKLAENLLSAFQTGVEYQMYHALALLAVAILARLAPRPLADCQRLAVCFRNLVVQRQFIRPGPDRRARLWPRHPRRGPVFFTRLGLPVHCRLPTHEVVCDHDRSIPT